MQILLVKRLEPLVLLDGSTSFSWHYTVLVAERARLPSPDQAVASSAQFIRFLNKINREVPDHLDVHVALDNLSTHKTPQVHKWLLRHRRFHFTPTYGSWMNLVERWFSALTIQKLQRSTHDSVNALAADITDWFDNWNNDPKPFVWQKTANEILERLGRYCAAVTTTEFDSGSA